MSRKLYHSLIFSFRTIKYQNMISIDMYRARIGNFQKVKSVCSIPPPGTRQPLSTLLPPSPLSNIKIPRSTLIIVLLVTLAVGNINTAVLSTFPGISPHPLALTTTLPAFLLYSCAINPPGHQTYQSPAPPHVPNSPLLTHSLSSSFYESPTQTPTSPSPPPTVVIANNNPVQTAPSLQLVYPASTQPCQCPPDCGHLSPTSYPPHVYWHWLPFLYYIF